MNLSVILSSGMPHSWLKVVAGEGVDRGERKPKLEDEDEETPLDDFSSLMSLKFFKVLTLAHDFSGESPDEMTSHSDIVLLFRVCPLSTKVLLYIDMLSNVVLHVSLWL